MSHNLLQNPSLRMDLSALSFFLFTPIIFIFPLFELQKYAYAYTEYEKCSSTFQCGSINGFGYPFYDGTTRPEYCGYPGFKINCTSEFPEISLSSSKNYYVVGIRSDLPVVTVARKDYWNTFCPSVLSNTTINFTLFEYYSPDSENITLYYECLDTSYPNNQFLCANNLSDSSVGYFVSDMTTVPEELPLDTCKEKVLVPFINYESFGDRINNNISLTLAFRNGFDLEWKAENTLCDACTKSGGFCGHNTTEKFTCYCVDHAYNSRCPGATPNKKHRLSRHALTKSQTAMLASFSALATCILVILFIYFTRRNSKDNIVLEVSRPKSKQEVEAFLRNCGITNPKRYSYTELKAITNSFKDTLGEGGYGTVYRGRLHNGNLVAVKILKKPKGDPMEFINEVASIGTTNHKNIVTLVGFCYEGHKRALVYDFMPNGSLEKFAYGVNNHQSLAWEKLFQIAVGIARGLEYLHQGCKTRILHFDIKPHNILLDENFCPKISDFGLAKSCPQKDSIISMSGARGTVGYIAPEVFLRSFGGVSQKSDVYSYGMLVLEMVGSRKNSGVKVEHGSEDYFPDWIYRQLEQQEELDYLETLNDEDRQLWRKMVLVSLWCTQTSPQSRPTMTRVVEMLEGATESLQVPPIPILASPPRSISLQDSSTSPTISIS